MLLSKGRVVVKTSGRDAGHVAVITRVVEGKYEIFGPLVRKKLVSSSHLEPLPEVLPVEKMKEEEILEKLEEIEAAFSKVQLDKIELLAVKAKRRIVSE